MLGYVFEDYPRSVAVRTFGEQIANSLDGATTGLWEGPIFSGYGIQLVNVKGRAEEAASGFEEIRRLARRELLNSRRISAN